MRQKTFNLVLFLCATLSLYAQENMVEKILGERLVQDEITRAYLMPAKVVWQSDTDNRYVTNSDVLLKSFEGQLSTDGSGMCVLRSDSANQASILFDYGKEIYGGIRIAAAIRNVKRPVKVRVRLGESVSEAMSDCGKDVPGMESATNDHSLRDFTIEVPWLGTIEVGNSGFRFVRIDLVDQNVELPLRAVQAVFRYRDIQIGRASCRERV